MYSAWVSQAGVRRDFAALEARRMEAARLLRQGLSQSEVARAVGVHRQSVSRWAQELERSGVRGLRQAKRTGRPELGLPRRRPPFHPAFASSTHILRPSCPFHA